ncbi:hypothetical protein BGW38_002525 [Lunasporangiospora selenospora]|uniref:Uncharacterized protein n=1 Tax=Lunasporangiospora selenospora TaxID=979761 RepID=A0A9P6FT36_9FUNG|nr:hypothetical protein BGW38_002525 [Lunasporangiospora selenospora]
MVEKPTLTSDKTRNSGIVKEYVQRRIIEAVEDGTGELDLSSLELDDLPTEIKDMNYAVVYSERGSFSLTKNRLKLFLSSNHFRTIPMGVFSLQNLSVLSLRNNYLETIPPEIGLLHNLVELSIGGNKLKYLPSQIVLLPNLQILTVHPNLFKKPSQESSSGDTQGNGIETLPADGPAVQALPTQVIHTPTSVGAVGTFSTPLLTIEDPGRVRPIYQTGPTSRLFQQPLGFGVGASNSTVEANSIATHSWTSPILDGDDTEMVLVPNSNLGLYSGSQYSTDRPQNVTLDNIPLEVTDIEMEEDNLLPSWSQSSEQSNMTSTSADIAAEAFRSFLQREEDVDQVSYGQESQGSPAIDQIDVLSVGTQLRLAPGLIMETKHSRFPSLLTLAGNVILRCAQEPNKSVSDTEAVTGENMEALDNRVDGCQSFLGRPTFASSYLSQEAQSRPREKSSTTELFKEDMIKSYLTPDLYEVYRRARLNNICAGCKRRFWKPCKVVLVWQDILGQSQVPFEWKGCGIGACPSLPEQMLLHSEQSTKRAGSSSADNSMLDGAEDGEEIFSMTI